MIFEWKFEIDSKPSTNLQMIFIWFLRILAKLIIWKFVLGSFIIHKNDVRVLFLWPFFLFNIVWDWVELHWQENQFFLANTVSQNICVDNFASLSLTRSFYCITLFSLLKVTRSYRWEMMESLKQHPKLSDLQSDKNETSGMLQLNVSILGIIL